MSESIGRLLAAGSVAEVFEWGSRVVKLYRAAGAKEAVFREAGNHSAVAFIPAGLAQPSAKPSRVRRPARARQLWARPCAMLMSDQAVANSANPIFNPTTSRK